MKMSVEDYENDVVEFNGYCKACDKVTTFGGVEADARGYECDVCHGKTVLGIEEAIMMGHIEVEEEEDGI